MRKTIALTITLLLGLFLTGAVFAVNVTNGDFSQGGIIVTNNLNQPITVFLGQYGNDSDTWSIVGPSDKKFITFYVQAKSTAFSASTYEPTNEYSTFVSAGDSYGGHINFGVTVNLKALNPPPLYFYEAS